ncbi:hypothetical protein L1987_70868 [Smallanthus sonchifolius]|uniref:Uncharacterized protein n=1 Tax=Smallanthus sonchifolius TaxID=185202 RepID=A0ACB9AR30_9ASTR|nr:hypothetical protein L1987_70868 [Smallanthus sonchifolius]
MMRSAVGMVSFRGCRSVVTVEVEGGGGGGGGGGVGTRCGVGWVGRVIRWGHGGGNSSGSRMRRILARWGKWGKTSATDGGGGEVCGRRMGEDNLISSIHRHRSVRSRWGKTSATGA